MDLDDRIARSKQEAARRIAAKISSQSAPTSNSKNKKIKSNGRNASISYQVRSRLDQFLDSIERNGNAHNIEERERIEHISQLLLDPNCAEYYQRKKLQIQKKISSASKKTVTASPSISVGILADACKLAARESISPYTPLPPHIIIQAKSVPVLEKDRLEARIADFYQEMYQLDD
ncbi:unnamed protein product [Albugo candida]|uniref:Uncharacterized protein n=1 Tax=Albugo candida TaxID=65357 RepID=A0A024GAI9_9STRA|nr:unnamed protein product [Albugo candida]|eukprot:CCI43783.1 unnamed protein product [Albugo candida]